MKRLLQAIFLISAFSLFAEDDSNYSCGYFEARNCHEAEIYNLIDYSYTLNLEGDYNKIAKAEQSIKAACPTATSENLKNYCKIFFLIDKYYISENFDDRVNAFDELIEFANELILLPHSSDYLEVFDVLLSGIDDGMEITYEFIISTLKELQPNEEDNSLTEIYYSAIWHLTYANLIFEYEDPKEVISAYDLAIKKSKQLVDNDSIDDQELFLESKLRLSEYLFAVSSYSQEYAERGFNILIEVLNQTNLEDSPNLHFRSWQGLLEFNDQVVAGSTQDNFLIRVFINNYFSAVLNNGYYDIEIDKIFLDYFPIYFLDLDCYERFDAWQTYKELRDFRAQRFAPLIENVEDLEPWDSVMSNRGLIMDCQEEIPDNEFFNQAVIDHKQNIIDILDTPTENLQTLALFYSWFGILRIKDHLPSQESFKLFDKFNAKLNHELDWYLTETTISTNIAQVLLTGYFGLLEHNQENANKLIPKMESVIKLYVSGREKELFSSTQDAVVMKIVTIDLYDLGFQNEAKNFYLKYFKNFDYQFIQNDQNIFVSDEMYEITKFVMNVITHSQDQNTNDLFKSLVFLGRSPMELGLTTHKVSDGNVYKTIKFFNEVERKKNEYVSYYFDSILEENITNQNIQQKYIELVNRLSSLDEAEMQLINKTLYPDSSIENIQKKLQANEVLSFNFKFLILGNDYMINMIVDQNDYEIKIHNLSHLLGQSIDDYFFEFEEMLFSNFVNQDNIDLIKLEDISNLFLPKNIDVYKKITFITNFFDSFNSNLLRHKNSWIIENYEIKNYFSIANFLNDAQSSKQNVEKYIGFGDVDYSRHQENFFKLPETRDEINESSKFFKSRKVFLGKDANERKLKSLDFKDSVIHFATHTNNPYLSLMPDPALVLSPSKSTDGYLSIFEISDLNFSESHIILAACDTDASITTDFDYMSGLVKSFVLSGAKSLLATKWDIETTTAKEITVQYSNLLSQSNNPQQSIQSIQNKLISKGVHPYIWSGYFVVN